MRTAILLQISMAAALSGPAGLLFGPCAAAQEVLLIPDTATDTVGRYDPHTGDYLGDLIVDPDPTVLGWLDMPIHAVLGPDGLLYVSDQTRDAVVRFTAAGEFVDDFADATDGLDNVRGLAFIGETLFVCHAPAEPNPPSIVRFDLSGIRRPDFAVGVNCFDVHDLDAGLLITDISNDRIDLYDPATGQPIAEIAVTDFPEQIARKRGGNLLVIAYLANEIIELSPAGLVLRRLPITNLGRGVAELGNGNLLISTSAGIREISPADGTVLRTIRSGQGFRFIERINFGSPCTYEGCDVADITADCAVDLADLSLLLANFGSSGSLPGDLDASGDIDIGDLGLMLSVYGNDCR